MQFQDTHAVTVLVSAPVSAYRFLAYDGAPATSAGGVHDSQGITHTAAVAGERVAAITGYSGLVEAGADITAFAFVKPAADGSGKAIPGTATDHCGRALMAATTGQRFEVQVLPHRHT